MSETLYRKYRPKTFAEIVDQRHIRITLQQALTQDRVAHAYLFAGPRGTGKTTVARLLARAVNCQQPGREGEPCNQCATCSAMNQDRSLDVIEIDAASQTGVDNVRENIIQSARVVPSLGKYKVFIIDEVHMLSLAAFNALLKLLEEPPAHAMFVLATTDVHRVPTTIISRTQRFDFKKLGAADIAVRLNDLAKREGRRLEEGVAERIARHAAGSLRDAESMLGQLFSFQDKLVSNEIADLVLPRSNEALTVGLLGSLVRGQTTSALQDFHAFLDEGGDVPALLHDLVLMSRALLLSTIDPTMVTAMTGAYAENTTQEILNLAGKTSSNTVVPMVETLLEAEKQLYRGALVELPVEVAIIKLGGQTPVLPSREPATPTESKVPSPTKRSPAPKVAKPKSTGQGLTHQSVRRAWQQIQTQTQTMAPSLRLSVQQAWVAGVDGSTIKLEVPFALHQQRLIDPKHRRGLEEQLSQAIDSPVTIEVHVNADQPSTAATAAPAPVEKPAKPKSQTADLWDQVVSSFG